MLPCVAVCVAVSYIALCSVYCILLHYVVQCGAVWRCVIDGVAVRCNVCYSVLQGVADVLQLFACLSDLGVLQCVLYRVADVLQ